MIYSENILLCIAMPLAVMLLFIRGKARNLVLAFLIGMGICLISAYISGYVSLLAGMDAGDAAVYISPVIEELMKMLPLLFYLYAFEPPDDQITLSAVALGAGFATFENCCYILSAGAESLRYTLIRGLAVGVMHVVSMLAFAIGLTLVRRFRAISFAGILGAISLAMTFHALYNLLVSGPGLPSHIGYALPVATAAVLYKPYRTIFRESG